MKRSRSVAAVAAALAIGVCASATASAVASEMVYRPINPAFGGDPFNSSFLLETARAQKPGGDGIKFPEINFDGFEGPVIVIDGDGNVSGGNNNDDQTPP